MVTRILSVVGILIVTAVYAQESPVRESARSGAHYAPDAEVAAIRAISQEFVAAFNRGDAKALAAHWTENGDVVDEAGHKLVGRAAIAQEYAQLFKAQPKVKLQLAVDSIKVLTETAAVEEGRSILDPAPVGAPAIGKYLAVHVKVDGKWLMSTVRESRIELPSTYGNLADLEWLIGTWTAEEHGAKTVSVCCWIGHKSFVERRYTTTTHDGLSTTGLQIIGWNPQAGRVQSWNFSGDGGHAVGLWQAAEGGWEAEVVGTTAQGETTTAVNSLRKLDENAYVWQSTQRTLNGNPLPDSDEIVLKRSPR